MRNTITVRLDDDLAAWLEHAAAKSGISQGEIVREQLREAKKAAKNQKGFMRLAGSVDGPRNLSQRKGFSRK